MIQPSHKIISIRRQSELIGLSRSSYYYNPICTPISAKTVSTHLTRPIIDTPENLGYMVQIDHLYMVKPFYGSRRMTFVLNQKGFPVNRKRIQRLMRQMGIQAIYPKPRLSVGQKGHKIYPYLLRDLLIDRPDQVWCADITYIPRFSMDLSIWSPFWTGTAVTC